MTTRPDRIIDAHVHFWDPARTDWYPYLGGGQDLGMGDVSAMARPFSADIYRGEASEWNVEGWVNVAAATGHHSVAETLEVDRQAEASSRPTVIIGGLPPADSAGDAIATIDAQLAAPRFRGVRPMNPKGPPVPDDEVLRALADRNLLFELMAHPPELADAARRLAAHPELTVVVEHTGWPRRADDAERAQWLTGLEALARAGDHVHIKLSGLAMPLAAMTADAFRPWLEPAIEAFGVRRCLFASNFPVDGLHGTLDQLWTAYAEVTSGLDHRERGLLFAANAERIYRC